MSRTDAMTPEQLKRASDRFDELYAYARSAFPFAVPERDVNPPTGSGSPICAGSMGGWRLRDSVGSVPKQCPCCGALEEILIPDRRFAGLGRVPVHAPARSES